MNNRDGYIKAKKQVNKSGDIVKAKFSINSSGERRLENSSQIEHVTNSNNIVRFRRDI